VNDFAGSIRQKADNVIDCGVNAAKHITSTVVECFVNLRWSLEVATSFAEASLSGTRASELSGYTSTFHRLDQTPPMKSIQ
jgi:hypothetical protein